MGAVRGDIRHLCTAPPLPLSHSFSYPSLAEGFSAIIELYGF